MERKVQGWDFRLGLSNWPLTTISSSDLVNSDHQRTNKELEKSLLIPKKTLGFFPPFQIVSFSAPDQWMPDVHQPGGSARYDMRTVRVVGNSPKAWPPGREWRVPRATKGTTHLQNPLPWLPVPPASSSSQFSPQMLPFFHRFSSLSQSWPDSIYLPRGSHNGHKINI